MSESERRDEQDAAVAVEHQPRGGTATKPETDADPSTRRLPPFHVVLHDDDEHSFEYVIEMMSKLFGHPFQRGFEIAEKVHHEGRAVVLTTTKEHAELKRDQVHAYGPDKFVADSTRSMRSHIEPAQGGD